jgi:hypothetical protein
MKHFCLETAVEHARGRKRRGPGHRSCADEGGGQTE